VFARRPFNYEVDVSFRTMSIEIEAVFENEIPPATGNMTLTIILEDRCVNERSLLRACSSPCLWCFSTRNDAPAVSVSSHVVISATAAVGTVIANMTVNDEDGDAGVFSLLHCDAGSLYACPFVVDPNDGSVLLNASLANTNLSSFELALGFVETNRTPPLMGVASVTVIILGNFPPVFRSSKDVYVLMHQPVGTVIYTALVTSRINSTNKISFSIVDGNTSRFAIDADTGQVRSLVMFGLGAPTETVVIQAAETPEVPPVLYSNHTVRFHFVETATVISPSFVFVPENVPVPPYPIFVTIQVLSEVSQFLRW
jgi:hypothetical protein